MHVPVRLEDGTDAWVRELRPDDRERLAEEFRHLSEESRRQRFLTPVAELTETMLEHLVDDVDGVDHVALVLGVGPGPDEGEAVAVARMIRDAGHPDAADVAVTVKDDWQGRGVAGALLAVLVEHRPAGVTRLVTEVQAENAASLAMLRRLGPTETTARPGSYDVEVRLDAAPEEGAAD